MKRKDFIQKSLLGSGIIGSLTQCIKTVEPADSQDTTIISDPTKTPDTCTVTNSETKGPFPNKASASYTIKDITGDRKGTTAQIKIYVRNVNNDCAIIKDAIVDIWHCDSVGNYSEYGTETAKNYLRGRQSTDSNGMAGFLTIFPGWYSGRAPHIHVEVLNASAKSLLVTQIAFPKETCDIVYSQGEYKSKGLQDTINARDNVFSDGVTTEMPTITGDTTKGFEIVHTIFVKG